MTQEHKHVQMTPRESALPLFYLRVSASAVEEHLIPGDLRNK